jgi:hypothetical protein
MNLGRKENLEAIHFIAKITSLDLLAPGGTLKRVEVAA